MTSTPQTSLLIDVPNANARLHLRRIGEDAHAPAILMVHGAVANARTFYSEKGRGLGPWLAAQGYDVFVLDLRGRGLSTPRIARGDHHGQTESIAVDIPLALTTMSELKPADAPIHLVAHSWGGVLLSSMLARNPSWAAKVASCVYLGSKRSITVWNSPRLFEIELFWKRLAKLTVALWGYLPANQIGIGSDNETAKSLRQSQQWIRPAPWVDSDDGFDYAAALAQRPLPPTLYLIGGDDPVRGHEVDVRRFAAESGEHHHAFELLCQANGFCHDYDHIGMLTAPDAAKEVYPRVLRWIKQFPSANLSTELSE